MNTWRNRRVCEAKGGGEFERGGWAWQKGAPCGQPTLPEHLPCVVCTGVNAGKQPQGVGQGNQPCCNALVQRCRRSCQRPEAVRSNTPRGIPRSMTSAWHPHPAAPLPPPPSRLPLSPFPPPSCLEHELEEAGGQRRARVRGQDGAVGARALGVGQQSVDPGGMGGEKGRRLGGRQAPDQVWRTGRRSWHRRCACQVSGKSQASAALQPGLLCMHSCGPGLHAWLRATVSGVNVWLQHQPRAASPAARSQSHQSIRTVPPQPTSHCRRGSAPRCGHGCRRRLQGERAAASGNEACHACVSAGAKGRTSNQPPTRCLMCCVLRQPSAPCVSIAV